MGRNRPASEQEIQEIIRDAKVAEYRSVDEMKLIRVILEQRRMTKLQARILCWFCGSLAVEASSTGTFFKALDIFLYGDRGLGDGAVRTQLSRLRKELQEFYGANPLASIEIRIPSPAPAEFHRRSTSEPNPHLKQFWAPYLRGDVLERSPTLLLYTEPLFWRDNRVFLRSLDDNVGESNEPPSLPSHIRTSSRQSAQLLMSAIKALKLKPIHQFVSAGEARCLARLAQVLAELKVRVDFEVSHALKPDWSSIVGRDLVILGNVRTHWAVRKWYDKHKKEADCVFRAMPISVPN